MIPRSMEATRLRLLCRYCVFVLASLVGTYGPVFPLHAQGLINEFNNTGQQESQLQLAAKMKCDLAYSEIQYRGIYGDLKTQNDRVYNLMSRSAMNRASGKSYSICEWDERGPVNIEFNKVLKSSKHCKLGSPADCEYFEKKSRAIFRIEGNELCVYAKTRDFVNKSPITEWSMVGKVCSPPIKR